MKELYLVTHTQAEHHLTRKVGGWFDSALTEKGRQDALQMGVALRALGLEGAPIFSSDLQRAKQTALMMNDALSSEISYDARLREMSYGRAEGKDQSWLDERIVPVDETNRLDHVVVEGAETKRTLATRLYSAMADIAQCDRAVVCTHGYAATFLIAAWLDIPLEAIGRVNFNVASGSYTHLKEDDFFKNRALAKLSVLP